MVLNLINVAAAFGVLSFLFVGDNPPLGGAGALDVLSVASIFTICFALDRLPGLPPHAHARGVRAHPVQRSAIEFGIAKTAKVVTGAAAIMIAVFMASPSRTS